MHEFFLDHGFTSSSCSEDDASEAEMDANTNRASKSTTGDLSANEHSDGDNTVAVPMKKYKLDKEELPTAEPMKPATSSEMSSGTNERQTVHGSPPQLLHYPGGVTNSQQQMHSHVPATISMSSRGPLYHYPSGTSNFACMRMHQAAGIPSPLPPQLNQHSASNGRFFHQANAPMHQLAGFSLPPPSNLPPTILPPAKSIELLQRLFPEQNRHVLELILQACDGDFVQAIECMLPAHERLSSQVASKGQGPCACKDTSCIYHRGSQERGGSAFSPIGPRPIAHGKQIGSSTSSVMKVSEINRETLRHGRGSHPMQGSKTIPPVYIVNTSPSESPDSRVSSEEQSDATGERNLETKTKLCAVCGRRSSGADNFCSSCGKKL